MASDITWEKAQQIWVQTLTTNRRTNAQVQTVTCKNHSSKPFQTISNVSKMVSNKFIQLRKPLTMVLYNDWQHFQVLTVFQVAKQHALPNVRHFPAQTPSEADRYGREDGNVERYDKAISTNTYL